MCRKSGIIRLLITQISGFSKNNFLYVLDKRVIISQTDTKSGRHMSLSYKKQKQVMEGAKFVKVYNHKNVLKYAGFSMYLEPYNKHIPNSYYPVGEWLKFHKRHKYVSVIYPQTDQKYPDGTLYKENGIAKTVLPADLEQGNISFNLPSTRLFSGFKTKQGKMVKFFPNIGSYGNKSFFSMDISSEEIIEYLYINGILIHTSDVYPYLIKQHLVGNHTKSYVVRDFQRIISNLPDLTGIHVQDMNKGKQ